MSWPKESRRHALARKGVKTVIDEDTRFDVSKFVARAYGDTENVNVLMASTMSIEEGMLPARIVLKHDKSNKNTPFITHLQIFPNYPKSMRYHYAYGGYFTNVESAKKEYNRKLDLYRVKNDPDFRRKE